MTTSLTDEQCNALMRAAIATAPKGSSQRDYDRALIRAGYAAALAEPREGGVKKPDIDTLRVLASAMRKVAPNLVDGSNPSPSAPSPAPDVAGLVERLREMSSRKGRNDYGIGDYWNACDDAADALALEHARAEELEARLARVIEAGDAMVTELNLWVEENYHMPEATAAALDAYRAAKDAP